MDVLNTADHSMLTLLKYSAEAEAHLKTEAKKFGFGEERMVFMEPKTGKTHVKRRCIADLVLDAPI